MRSTSFKASFFAVGILQMDHAAALIDGSQAECKTVAQCESDFFCNLNSTCERVDYNSVVQNIYYLPFKT